jgi:RNA-directed DNA polymerase
LREPAIKVADGVAEAASIHLRSLVARLRIVNRELQEVLDDLARLTNPVARGWTNYCGRFYRSRCIQVLRHLIRTLPRFADFELGA